MFGCQEKNCLYILSQELTLWTDHQQNSQCPATWGVGMSDFLLGAQSAEKENIWQKGFLGMQHLRLGQGNSTL